MEITGRNQTNLQNYGYYAIPIWSTCTGDNIMNKVPKKQKKNFLQQRRGVLKVTELRMKVLVVVSSQKVKG
jgi:hypothetical protein